MPETGGGGGTQVLNGYTHYQMATQSRSSERQNLGGSASFKAKTERWGCGGGGGGGGGVNFKLRI